MLRPHRAPQPRRSESCSARGRGGSALRRPGCLLPTGSFSSSSGVSDLPASLRQVQGKIKSRALPHRAFRPDTAPVPTNDAFDGGQADARALEFLVGMKALESPEELAGVSHVEARSVVSYEIGRCAVLSVDPELDPGPGALAGKFPRVPEQV